MTNEEREQKIRAAIAERIAEGWKIRDCITRDPTLKECCPLGALGGKNYMYSSPMYLAKDYLDVIDISGEWSTGFTTGFDGTDPVLVCRDGRQINHEAYELGKKFRKELITE